jgi:decaprenyl-phosphate phosphoribosyltransferase
MKNLITLIRPKQYTKNIFILLPLFFAGKITNTELFLDGLIAFAAFSLSASAIYILNDYKDIKSDQKHPKKKNRPLASGLVDKNLALSLMIILLIAGFLLMSTVSMNSLIVLCAYVILNISYSFKLKQIALLDVTIIATGFVLRLFAGSFAYDVQLKIWIVIMTFLLALFMALAKRRDDVLILSKTGKKMRKSIDGYNLQLIDGTMLVMSAVVIVAYIQYATSQEIIEKFQNENLYLTTLFVIFGIMRYLQITFVEKKSDSPTEIILKDKIIQINCLFWVLSFMWIIYFPTILRL